MQTSSSTVAYATNPSPAASCNGDMSSKLNSVGSAPCFSRISTDLLLCENTARCSGVFPFESYIQRYTDRQGEKALRSSCITWSHSFTPCGIYISCYIVSRTPSEIGNIVVAYVLNTQTTSSLKCSLKARRYIQGVCCCSNRICFAIAS